MKQLAVRIALFVLVLAPVGAQIPAPATHFGHEVTADRILLDWQNVVAYFQALEKSSPKIRVEVLGKTTLGRPFIAALISAPENLKRAERLVEVQAKLAEPRLNPQNTIDALVAEGKTIVVITCSIHSTEVASTHSAVQFAYRMLTNDSAKFKTILDNVVLILVPSLNPDGVDIVTEWYRRTVDTPFEGTSPPELYHKYTGHDNNRDWYMFTQVETRLTVSKILNVWRPHIVYDVHQQSADGTRMFVPPWLDPVEPNVDPILVQEMNHLGTGVAMDLTAAGKQGISVHSSYDFWSPSRAYMAFHGGMRILTESASARLATPVTIQPKPLHGRQSGIDPTQRSWNHPDPWPGGEWRLRDIVEYQMLAMESVLHQAAIRREDILRNFYRVHKRQVERTTPYAFVIPAQQADPGATRRLIETLAFGGVEVEIESDGSHRIRMQQPYSGWAKALLERQRYPDLREFPGGPPKRPYDVTAHTLPLLMGVEVRMAMRPYSNPSVVRPATEKRGRLPASDTDTWAAVNRIWKAAGVIYREPKSGDFAPISLGPEWKPIPKPRIAIYRSHVPQMDEGWTRWMLEQLGFEFTNIGNAQVQAGGLRERADVIVFPDQSPASIETGYRPGTMPDEFAGGLGEAGAKALIQFALEGGTLVFLNRSGEWAAERLQLKLKNAVAATPSAEFYAPGSLLNVKLDLTHPLCYGLPEEIAVWVERSPAWDTQEKSVARYGTGNLLASGWLLGESLIARRSALVEVPAGKGRVVLFGFRPQYRGQSYQALKLLLNSFLLHNRS